jgi:hypothetical protein
VSLTGLAGAVAYVIGAVLPGSAPKPDASVAAIDTFFTGARGLLLTGVAIELVGVALLIVFVGCLYRLMVSAGDAYHGWAATMLVAFTSTVTVVAAGTVPAIAVIWRGAPLPSTDLVRLVYDVETLSTYAVTSTVAALSVAAPAVVIWRSGILPRWLCVFAAVEIVVNVVELIGLASRRGFDTGGYAGGVGALLWVAWFAAASICLARRVWIGGRRPAAVF